MFKKKENIVIIVVLIVMILAIVGVSYAAFNFSKIGTKVNSITTGSITMTYTETDNVINLSGALPTTDKTGKVRLNPGEYFDFTVSSEITGNVNINYEISAKDVTTSDRKIDGSNIKLYLTEIVDGEEQEVMSPKVYNEEAASNEYTGRPSGEMSLYTSSMNSSEEHHYRLRMYVTEEYNPQGDGGNLQFSVKINVYGKDGEVPSVPAGETIIANLSSGITYDDGVDTFITGEDPNNYIWYSGKLWRAVSVNNAAKTIKLVTQWNISTINYSSGSTAFEGSYPEEWLNDTTVDGFLGNLRDYQNFIVTDAKWDATEDATNLGSVQRPKGTSVSTDAVGLLNIYEYQSSNNGNANGYLNNGLAWWNITPSNSSNVRFISTDGSIGNGKITSASGVRPSINLKSNVKIVDGDGTIDNPYRLNGDNDTDLLGTSLSSRYSGEYLTFGIGENNLYRIVSHENGSGTKIVSAEPLKDTGTFKTISFGSNITFSSTNTIGIFLNSDYLTNYVGNPYIDMIEDSTTWYIGTVEDSTSYKLSKYTDTNMSSLTSFTTSAKVGLLRYGELMSGQFVKYGNNSTYWTLTPYSDSSVWISLSNGSANNILSTQTRSIRPSLNLKSNVIITGGDGTENNPFTLKLDE